MTAYACEPEKGSEPGVGWGWCNGIAEHVEVTVVTRANNRPVIEEYYNRADPDGVVKRPKFLYYDPGPFFLWLKKKRILPVQVFFAFWMLGVIIRFREEAGKTDLIHHVTYSAITFPGMWWFARKPVVLGPVGGTSIVSSDYIALYGGRKWKELFRAWLIRHWMWLPWVRGSFSKASLIMCSNSDANERISQLYAEKTKTMTEIGADSDRVPLGPLAPHQGNHLELVWIGMVEPWKAWSITLQAVQKAKDLLGSAGSIHLSLLGRGSEESAAHTMAESLGITNEVTFLRRIPLEDLHDLIKNSDAMVFSSVKDTSGTVVLEAMGNGKTIVCINHQGVGDMTTDQTAIRVEPGSLVETIDGFANAMVKLASEPELRQELCERSRNRVLKKYIWERKAEVLYSHYREVLGIG